MFRVWRGRVLANAFVFGVTAAALPSHAAKPDPAWLRDQGIYEVLLGELALQRNNHKLAARLYANVARKSGEPGAFRRAMEIAAHLKDHEQVLSLAKQWVKTSPKNLKARQNLIAALVRQNQAEDLEEQLKHLLELDIERLPNNLLGLSNLLRSFKDKQHVSLMVRNLTSPYLKHPEAHFARALAALGAKHMKNALQAINRGLELKPGWDKAALLKSSVLAQDSKENSLAFLEAYLREKPDAREVRMHLARQYAAQKQFEQSRRQFDYLLKDNPDSPEVIYPMSLLAIQTQDLEYAKKLLGRLLKLHPEGKDRVYFFLGQIAEQEKNTVQAISAYQKVNSGSQYLLARIRIANLYAKTQRLDQARSVLRDSLGINKKEKIQLWLTEAQLLREAKKLEEAARVLENGLLRYPDHPDLLYESALTDERLDAVDQMEQKLRRLIELEPNNAHAKNALGYSLADRSLRLDEALELIKAAVALKPKDPFIMDSLGWVYYRRGDLMNALKFLQQALALRPDPEIAAHLGEVLWESGRQQDAKKIWQGSLDKHPDNELLQKTLRTFMP